MQWDCLLAGTTRAVPQIKAVRQMGSVVLLDGDGGLGQVVGSEAMRRAIALAKEQGVGVVAVLNSSHFGASSYFARLPDKPSPPG
jgi:ureidoglycolate dehydrogenase (NAD+)